MTRRDNPMEYLRFLICSLLTLWTKLLYYFNFTVLHLKPRPALLPCLDDFIHVLTLS